jgi:hypothetical protein
MKLQIQRYSVCVKSESGDLIGLGVAKREDKLTSVMVGIPENSLNSLIDVACEKKIDKIACK